MDLHNVHIANVRDLMHYAVVLALLFKIYLIDKKLRILEKMLLKGKFI